MIQRLIATLVILAPLATNLNAETREEWIKLGERVHGAFGSFIPVGIRIGLDALARLEAKPRELAITFYSGEKSPCPCVADGVMIAVSASPGQGTLQVAPEKAPVGLMAMVIIKHRKTGATLKYTVAESWLLKLGAWNRTLDPPGRYDEVMKAEGLFEVTP
jgi:formylmethanofuran dehydrogenase subunit E